MGFFRVALGCAIALHLSSPIFGTSCEVSIERLVWPDPYFYSVQIGLKGDLYENGKFKGWLSKSERFALHALKKDKTLTEREAFDEKRGGYSVVDFNTGGGLLASQLQVNMRRGLFWGLSHHVDVTFQPTNLSRTVLFQLIENLPLEPRRLYGTYGPRVYSLPHFEGQPRGRRQLQIVIAETKEELEGTEGSQEYSPDIGLIKIQFKPIHQPRILIPRSEF